MLIKNNLYKNIKFSDEYAINWSEDVDNFIKNSKIQATVEKITPDNRIIGKQLNSISEIYLKKFEDSVIWATGFRYNYDWIDLDITDKHNHPLQKRGITKFPGFYFMGLQWMHSSKSAQFIGVAEDANFIVNDIFSKNFL